MLRMVSETERLNLHGTYDLRSLCAAVILFKDGDDDPEDDPDDVDSEGDDGEGASGADAGDGKESKSKGKDDKSIKDPAAHRSSQEAARYRRELRDTQKRLKEYEDKDKSELELAQSTAKEQQERADKAEARALAAERKLTFLMTPAARQFKDVADALKLLDSDALEPDDDGKYDKKVAEQLLVDLAKKYPALVDASGSSSDDGEGSNNGQPSGRPANGKGGKGKEADRAALEKRFPALAGRS